MNQSAKSIIAFVILICLGASVLGWTSRGIGGVPDSRFWLRASGIILLPAVGLLLWADFRRDLAPDLLRSRAKRYFEQDGFCFAILPATESGSFALQIFFQNRYERPVKAVVAFRPAARFVGFGHPGLEELRVNIDCEGGSFGFANVPCEIPPALQGKKQKFELIAASHFPEGKGKMLRFRDGLKVGKHHKSAADTALTVLSAMALHVHFKNPATFCIRLPVNVESSGTGKVTQTILWRLGDQVRHQSV